MTQNVNLNALRVFVVAARHGNFQRAADELNLSHGAVSQRMKQLELDLGVVLFQRRPRGVSLTAHGQKFRDSIEPALSAIASATADMERASARITLHLGSSFASKWLMPRMRAFASKYPDISITTETHTELLERNLGRNEIAIWPARSSGKNPADQIVHLAELQLVAVCSPSLLRSGGRVDLETLLSFPLLQDVYRRWEHLIEMTGYEPSDSLLNFDRSALALDAAIKGHGVAIAPTYLIEEDLRSGQLVEIWRNPGGSGEHLFMSWAKQHMHDKHLMQTVNWVMAEFDLVGVL